MSTLATAILSPRVRMAALPPDEPDPTMTLQGRLDRAARANDYLSYADMDRRLSEDGRDLGKGERYKLLKHLAPMQHDIDNDVKARTMPVVDATGLAAIAEIQKSVARLIRVLLLGYTCDELDELADRMKAEHAQELDSVAGQRRGQESHTEALSRLDTAAGRGRIQVAP